MDTITLSLKDYHSKERIFAEFPYNKKISDAIRQVPGIQWSQADRSWHLPAEKKSVQELQQKINSLAVIDASILKKQLEEKKKNAAGYVASSHEKSNAASIKRRQPARTRYLYKNAATQSL
jgi:gluconate kinase